jgi:tetratricopeptide (TPR) repeat protein
VFVLYLARRYEESIREALETLEMDPTHTSLLYYLGLAYVGLQAFDEAFEALGRIGPPSQAPGGRVMAAMAYAQARAGRRSAAVDTLSSLEALSRRQYVSAYEMALVHIALGDHDRALALLAGARDEFASALPFVSVDPRCDGIRRDARFAAFVDRLRLPRFA